MTASFCFILLSRTETMINKDIIMEGIKISTIFYVIIKNSVKKTEKTHKLAI
jgi:hypothetical protein